MEFVWQYVFPAKTISIDPRSGIKRRHHIHQSSLNKAVKKVAKMARINKYSFIDLRAHFGAKTCLLKNRENEAPRRKRMGYSKDHNKKPHISR